MTKFNQSELLGSFIETNEEIPGNKIKIKSP